MSIPNTSLSDNSLDKGHAIAGWSGTQGGAGAAVFYSGRIQYAMPDGNKSLTLFTSDPAKYAASHSFGDLNTWQAQQVASQFPGGMSDHFQVAGFLSMASLGAYNYIFWTATVNAQLKYYVLRVRPDGQEKPALATLDLSVLAGFTPCSNPAAFALPDLLPTLAGKLGCLVMGTAGTTHTGWLAPLVFDPATFEANGHWQPHDLTGGHWLGVSNQLAGDSTGTNLATKYTGLSAAWLNQGAHLSEGASTAKQYVPLAVVAHYPGHSPSCVPLAADLLLAFDQTYRTKHNTATALDVNAVGGLGDVHANSGATINTAPDGTLVATYFNTSNQVTTAEFIPSSSSDVLGLSSPAWTTRLVQTNTAFSSANTPCSIYLPLAPSTGPSPCAIPTADDSTVTRTYPNCTIQNYVQCTFTSSSGHAPELFTLYWGCLFLVPDYRMGTLIGGAGRALELMADAFPYPTPNPLLQDADATPSGDVSWLACSYDYLVGTDAGTSTSYEVKSSVGFKAAGNALLAGVGMRVESSLAAGFARLRDSVSTTHQASVFTVQSKALPAKLAGVAATNHLVLASQSALFASAPPDVVYVALGMVLRRGDTAPSGPVAAMLRVANSGTTPAVAGEFNAYCYQPNSLTSYLEANINQTMAGLYAGLNNNKDLLKLLEINGVKYDQVYSGNNYVAEVVKRFGRPIFGPAGNLPYLEYTFSETGMQRSEFQATTGFTSASSYFVNGSAYGGLAWDQETKVSGGFLGVIEVQESAFKSEGYVMLGAEFGGSLTSTTSEGAEWGIQLNDFRNPLGPGEAYTVRLYLLEASPLWAHELALFGSVSSSAPIDTNSSAPVRILFTVPYVSTALAQRLAQQ